MQKWKPKYPKWIRKKYHSPERRLKEFYKYIDSCFKSYSRDRFHAHKHTFLDKTFHIPDIHSFGMPVLNPGNVYVLSVDSTRDALS